MGSSVQKVRGYRNKYGTWVKSYTRRGNSGSPARSRARAKLTSTKGAAIAATCTVIITVAGVSAMLSLGNSPSVSNESNESRPASAESHEKVRLDLKSAQAALVASGYKINVNVGNGQNCSADSYGLVHRFFLAHPCSWVTRESLILHASSSSVILVAIAWVDMRSFALAKKYKRLVDASGTGNILELSRQSGPYQDIRFTGEFYDSGMVGMSVWNIQVQPTGQLPAGVATQVLKKSRQ